MSEQPKSATTDADQDPEQRRIRREQSRMIHEQNDQDLPTNWGRWGRHDERGTLNHITPESLQRAADCVQTGEFAALGLPVTPVLLAGGGPAAAGVTVMPAPVLQVLNYNPEPPAHVEVLVLNTHSLSFTHIDAPVHVPVAGKVYPGIPVEEAVHSGRAHHATTSAYADGIVTRGIMLDLAPGGRLEPGYGVRGADLSAAEERAGVTIEPGDAIVVRGGWTLHKELGEPLPGMTLDAVRWMADKEISLFTGDIGDRPPGTPGDTIPMHYVAISLLGMPLIDNSNVTPLIEICRRLDRYSFMFTIAPIPIMQVSGVPVNPICTF